MQHVSRRKIATHVKLLASLNALPAQYLTQLHPTQISRYRNRFNMEEYLGHDLIEAADDLIIKFRQLNQHTMDKKVVYAYLRLSATLRKELQT